MTAPNWKRTVGRLRRYMAELREYDCQVIEPPNFDLPPGRRPGGPIKGGPAVVGELGPEFIEPIDSHGRKRRAKL
jgi:hypothetical protein